jgi:hypothetical protein
MMVFNSQTIPLSSRCYYKSKQSQIISQKVSTNCTSLVPYGTNLVTTINMGRLSKNLQGLIYLPYNIYSIIVGKLLSDGWLDKEILNANTRFRFKQAVAKSDYVFYSFLLSVLRSFGPLHCPMEGCGALVSAMHWCPSPLLL